MEVDHKVEENVVHLQVLHQRQTRNLQKTIWKLGRKNAVRYIRRRAKKKMPKVAWKMYDPIFCVFLNSFLLESWYLIIVIIFTFFFVQRKSTSEFHFRKSKGYCWILFVKPNDGWRQIWHGERPHGEQTRVPNSCYAC